MFDPFHSMHVGIHPFVVNVALVGRMAIRPGFDFQKNIIHLISHNFPNYPLLKVFSAFSAPPREKK
jgi:hypothetical protein